MCVFEVKLLIRLGFLKSSHLEWYILCFETYKISSHGICDWVLCILVVIVRCIMISGRYILKLFLSKFDYLAASNQRAPI